MSTQKNEHIRLRSFIRESICNIIQEKDNRRRIVEKIKFPQHVADWAHSISEKYSIWIVNDFKERFLLDYIENDIVRNAAIAQLQKGKLTGGLNKVIEKSKESFEDEYRYIANWLENRGTAGVGQEIEKLNLRELSFEEAMRRAEEWNHNITQAEAQEEQELEIEDDDGEVVMTFPDGYYWINLGANYCEKEGSVMGHCGRGEGNLYSLRKDGESYITADILRDGTVRQMRGRANTKPKEKYHQYIIDFILSEHVKHFDYWDYRKHKNFWLKDLGNEKAREIIEQKPSLSKNQKLMNELVSTEVSNDGQGGIDSQTTSDTMNFYHSDGPLHQPGQPAERSNHIFFGDGGGNTQASIQSQAAAESGAKNQVEDGIEESEESKEVQSNKTKKTNIKIRFKK